MENDYIQNMIDINFRMEKIIEKLEEYIKKTKKNQQKVDENVEKK